MNNRDRNIFLILLQTGLVIVLFISDDLQTGFVFWRFILYLSLLVVCGWLLQRQIIFRRGEKDLTTVLKRAVNGNLNTRLSDPEHLYSSELIFTINRLIENLDQLQIKTIQSDTLKKQLLSNFSHDLRTPLTSIIGYVDALKDDIGASAEEKQAYLQIILGKAQTLKTLIDEIFDLARLDADELPFRPEELDLAETLREVAISFMPELKQNRMQLTAEIPDKYCPVLADVISLQRICGNLIKNAIEYGKSGGVLGINLTDERMEYHLIIWDKGQGIQADDLPNVFERLYRADRSRNSLNRGSGLGLAIARALVEKHGGNIHVESTPGEKTSFIVSLPKHEKTPLNHTSR
ncbi:MAG: HAMP domain-containing histidine kinase [Anaerolineae bacterium]|nr:HAMP domain-containing histidine kinase [Anaerolineae bacterium]